MSTRLVSRQSWKYGYFEADVKVPKGKGTWPAFWMLADSIRQPAPRNVAWPRCGEIDIMENVGFDPKKFHYSLHSEDKNFTKGTQRTFVLNVEKDWDFHRYGCDWRQDRIAFYFDGVKVSEFVKDEDTIESWPFREPFYIILNLAIGGSWGGAQGVSESIFPAKYEIRSVKIWQ